jgi:putative ABC transport system ATP-binding protein
MPTPVPESPAGGDPVVAIDGLRFAWRRGTPDVLAIEHLRLEAGRQVFLHGPSGCGKSTLLGVMAGVLVAREGSCRVLGQDWAALSGARRDAFRADHVGVLFQQFNLLPWLSVLDNVCLPAGFSARRARAGGVDEARRLLDRMALPPVLWTRPARDLSVGQQQRVAAARCLLGRPALVIADEPTSALDADHRDRFMDLLQGQCRDAGSTLVFVSHDRSLADRFDLRWAWHEVNRAPLAERDAQEVRA